MSIDYNYYTDKDNIFSQTLPRYAGIIMLDALTTVPCICSKIMHN